MSRQMSKRFLVEFSCSTNLKTAFAVLFSNNVIRLICLHSQKSLDWDFEHSFQESHFVIFLIFNRRKAFFCTNILNQNNESPWALCKWVLFYWIVYGKMNWCELIELILKCIICFLFVFVCSSDWKDHNRRSAGLLTLGTRTSKNLQKLYKFV